MKQLNRYISKYFCFIIAITYSCSDDKEIIEIPVNAVSDIQIRDLYNNGNASDIEVSFTKIDKEFELLEYRLITVSTEDNGVLDVEVASMLTEEFYQTITTSANDIKVRLDENHRTLSGELLKEEQFYISYILSVSNGQESNFNQLSPPSISFKFSTKSDKARNLFLMDVGNANNSSDLRLSFTKARSEERVSKYRIFLAKSEKAAVYTINKAEKLRSNQYKEINVNGENHIIDFGSSFLDTDGDLIVEGRPYEALILSLADGIIAIDKDLSLPSNKLILQNISYLKTLTDEFQGTGGLSYHPAGYLISGNTSGFFNAGKGLGTYKIDLDGTYELQTQNLENCKGNDYHPVHGGMLQTTKNGIFIILNDGTSRPFGLREPPVESETDIFVHNSGSIYISYCSPPKLVRWDFSPFFGTYVSITLGFYNDDEMISCMRYLELDRNDVPIIMNYNDNKLYKIKKYDLLEPPEIYAELPFGENFTSIVFVNSRNSLFATTSHGRIIQINDIDNTITTLVKPNLPIIMDGNLESGSFMNPVNITASTDGNTLYVSDEVNKKEGLVVLRKIELVD